MFATLQNVCYRFSHFHPDRYKPKNRPVFENSVAGSLKDKEDGHLVKNNSVYTTAPLPTEPVSEFRKRLSVENAINVGLAAGVLYLAHNALDPGQRVGLRTKG
jgi:hypothetical protein